MKIQINGDEVEVTDDLTIRQLLMERQVRMPEMVSVELNDEILERAEFATRRVLPGDRVEFLYFMGGGRGAH
jgi:sulfur carrier protein